MDEWAIASSRTGRTIVDSGSGKFIAVTVLSMKAVTLSSVDRLQLEDREVGRGGSMMFVSSSCLVLSSLELLTGETVDSGKSFLDDMPKQKETNFCGQLPENVSMKTAVKSSGSENESDIEIV